MNNYVRRQNCDLCFAFPIHKLCIIINKSCFSLTNRVSYQQDVFLINKSCFLSTNCASHQQIVLLIHKLCFLSINCVLYSQIVFPILKSKNRKLSLGSRQTGGENFFIQCRADVKSECNLSFLMYRNDTSETEQGTEPGR